MKSIDENELHWIPMRVTYGRELKVQSYLNSIGMQTFIPMKGKQINYSDGTQDNKLTPAIRNLIFVYSSIKKIKELKSESLKAKPLRFYVKHSIDSSRKEILLVPSKQMNDFISVVNNSMYEIIYLDRIEKWNEVGKVRITKGSLIGVEGYIKRIGRNKKVAVIIDGIAAVATFVPMDYVEFI